MEKSSKLTRGIAVATVSALTCTALVIGSYGLANTASAATSSSSSKDGVAAASSSKDGMAAASSSKDKKSSSASSEYTLDDIEAMMTEGYAGLNADSGEYYYWASNDDGSFVMLAIYDPESNQTVSYVGSSKTTGNNVTVTDYVTGNKIGFDVTVNDDETVNLDLGEEYGTAVLAQVDVSEVFDVFKALDQYTNQYTLDDIEAMMTEGYAGVNVDSGEYYYWASNDDGSFVMLAIYDDQSNATATYVGEATVTGNNVTVTDYATGDKIGFDVTSNSDGTVQLDMGEQYGTVILQPAEVSDVFEAFQNLDQYTQVVH